MGPKSLSRRNHFKPSFIPGPGPILGTGHQLGEGAGYKMGKSRVRNFLRPPTRQGKTFLAPPPILKSGNFSRPPNNMAKTSSYRVKTTPKLFVPPPSAWLKLFPPPPPFRRGKTSRDPPSRLVAPPPRN